MIATEPPVASAWVGRLALGYGAASGRTVLQSRQHLGPLTVQKSFYPEGQAVCHTVVLHPPGGIAAGDHLTLQVSLETGARALLTTPGAGKWYRSLGATARQILAFRVAHGAVLEWLPQENILFDRARAELSTGVDLDGDGVFFGWDVLCLGRRASGERFTGGLLGQRVEIRRGGALLWVEQSRLSGGDPLLESLVGLGGCPVAGTLIMAGPAVDEGLLTRCREVQAGPGSRCGITVLPGVLVARFLGHGPEAARRYFEGLWAILRPAYAGREAHRPRIWNT